MQQANNKILMIRDFLGGAWFKVGVGAMALLIWAASGLFSVQLNENAAILRFGKLKRTCGPGLNWHIPWPIEKEVIADVTSLHKITTADLDPDETLVLTKDENTLSVSFTIFWRVKDLANYLFLAKSPDAIVESVAESVMREIMSNTVSQDALTVGRQEIADRIKYKLQMLLDEYKLGIEIVDAQIGKIDPPESVVDAYRDVLKAKLEQEMKKNEAESYAKYIIPQAEGQAFEIRSKAKAEVAQILASAEGEASAARAMLDAYQTDPELGRAMIYTKAMSKVLSNASEVQIVPATGTLPLIHVGGKQ